PVGHRHRDLVAFGPAVSQPEEGDPAAAREHGAGHPLDLRPHPFQRGRHVTAAFRFVLGHPALQFTEPVLQVGGHPAQVGVGLGVGVHIHRQRTDLVCPPGKVPQPVRVEPLEGYHDPPPAPCHPPSTAVVGCLHRLSTCTTPTRPTVCR